MTEPPYNMSEVPRCARDLNGSVVYKVTNRKDWFSILGEIVHLCNEAKERRRRRHPDDKCSKSSAKPLALEYIVDRLDCDDPLWGYVVRTEKEGWLQGFITVTTFTSWHKWFKWDSLAEEASLRDGEAGLIDDDCEDQDLARAIRQWHEARKLDDGSLADRLERQYRDGNAQGTGIVWPHVAEISLLGGLGCGDFLTRLVIEDLQKPNRGFDFLVLQATEASVPFYERCGGFIRVGALARHAPRTADTPVKSSTPVGGSSRRAAGGGSAGGRKLSSSVQQQEQHDSGVVPDAKGNSDNVAANRLTSANFGKPSSPWIDTNGCTQCVDYVVKERGKTLKHLLDERGLSVADFRFFNRADEKLVSMKTKAKVRIGMTFQDSERPIEIAEKLGVTVQELVKINRKWYKGLRHKSEMIGGTKLLVPGILRRYNDHCEKSDSPVIAYRHWTNPTDPYEQTPPSYMMARSLVSRNARSVETPALNLYYTRSPKSSWEMKVTKVWAIEQGQERQRMSERRFDRYGDDGNDVGGGCGGVKRAAAVGRTGNPEKKLKMSNGTLDGTPAITRPSPFFVFCAKMRVKFASTLMKNLSTSAFTAELGRRWRALDEVSKDKYRVAVEPMKAKYARSNEVYRVALAEFQSRQKRLDTILRRRGAWFPTSDEDKCLSSSSSSKSHANEWKASSSSVAVVEVLNVELPPFPERPKRPQTAFFCFATCVRSEVKAQLPTGTTTGKLSQEIARRWNSMSEKRKAPHVARAEAEKLQYKKLADKRRLALEEFDRKMSEICPLLPPKTADCKDALELSRQKRIREEMEKERRRRWKKALIREKPVYLFNKVVELAYGNEVVVVPSSAEATKTTDGDSGDRFQGFGGASAPPSPLSDARPVACAPASARDEHDATTDSGSYGSEYYFVITFIPDLQWCRLVPMKRDGKFSRKDGAQFVNRDRWRLESEDDAIEVDVSATRCVVMKTSLRYCCDDADDERWAIEGYADEDDDFGDSIEGTNGASLANGKMASDQTPKKLSARDARKWALSAEPTAGLIRQCFDLKCGASAADNYRFRKLINSALAAANETQEGVIRAAFGLFSTFAPRFCKMKLQAAFKKSP
eukprot:g960.t1